MVHVCKVQFDSTLLVIVRSAQCISLVAVRFVCDFCYFLALVLAFDWTLLGNSSLTYGPSVSHQCNLLMPLAVINFIGRVPDVITIYGQECVHKISKFSMSHQTYTRDANLSSDKPTQFRYLILSESNPTTATMVFRRQQRRFLAV